MLVPWRVIVLQGRARGGEHGTRGAPARQWCPASRLALTGEPDLVNQMQFVPTTRSVSARGLIVRTLSKICTLMTPVTVA
jgi:hypothetical protein